SAVTLLREGMRVQLHATHLPNVSAGFAWCRILQRTIRQDQATPSYYWVDLEMSVAVPLACSYVAAPALGNTSVDLLGATVSYAGNYNGPGTPATSSVIEIGASTAGTQPLIRYGTPNNGSHWGISAGVGGAGP